MVSGILFGTNNGEANSISDWNVTSLDSNWSHTWNKGRFQKDYHASHWLVKPWFDWLTSIILKSHLSNLEWWNSFCNLLIFILILVILHWQNSENSFFMMKLKPGIHRPFEGLFNRPMKVVQGNVCESLMKAEVNLCFDQFVFKISEQIFEHYKTRAAACLLDVNFQNEMKRQPFPKGNKYETLLQQRHIQVTLETWLLKDFANFSK